MSESRPWGRTTPRLKPQTITLHGDYAETLTRMLIANHLGASALDPTGRDPEDCGVDR